MPQDKIPNTIKDHVADTLYIPLYLKSNETLKDRSFFNDPAACRMVGKIDYDFGKYDGAVRSAVGVCIRAKYFDSLATEFVMDHPYPVVVNLGCGLDTRFQRLGRGITDQAVFYELDLPEAIELRRKLLPEAKNDIYLAGSLFDTGWMDDLKQKHPLGDFFFIAEGVLMFFDKEEVKSFLVDLAQRFSGSEVAFDVTSSWMCNNCHRHDTLKYSKARFKLALDDDAEIEQWADNLKLKAVRHYGDFNDWKRCGFLGYWSMKLIPPMKNASRLLHCEII